MSAEILVMDSVSAGLLNSTLNPNDDWFSDFATFDSASRIQSAMIGNVAVIHSNLSETGSRLLVVNLGSPSFFDRFSLPHKREILRRILVAALSSFTRHVTIPKNWGPFNHGSRFSFRALPITARRTCPEPDSRIEVDRNPFGSQNVYVYNCSHGWNDLVTSSTDREKYESARRSFLACLSTGKEAVFTTSSSPSAMHLSDDSFFHQENNVGFDDWYKIRFTKQQRQFVDADSSAPVRLRGAAGTGKTLALAVKLLVSAKQRLAEGRPTRYLFLTHSVATSETTTMLLSSLDNEQIEGRLLSSPGFHLSVSTLLELAMEAVGSDLQTHGVLPLATDALEGRQLQLELIESELAEYAKTKDWMLLRGLVSDHFRGLMSEPKISPAFRRFAWEIMNEFACVLDADGVQSKPDLRKRYLTAQRQAWMMPLSSEADRKVVLTIYDRFNEQVRQMNAITVDQVISDYLNFLDSFRWNAVREKLGFDLIFVDELHLFNRQERMVLHGLTRSATESPGLFMAYDAKQAPADTFMPNEARESSSTFWGRLKVGGIQKVELSQVFRYTPQISSFIRSLDQSFPALDLGEEWGEYDVTSEVASAEVPSISILKNDDDLYEKVMQRAHAIKRKGGQKFALAVLCCNPDRFDTFRNAGTHKKYFNSVASREEAGAARVDAFRFVLSSPDYVAGLQFDCVMLIDVNKSEIQVGPYSTSSRRKFISTVYLGASRAKRHLELYCTELEGGPSQILDGALDSQSLKQTSWDDLPVASEVAQLPQGLAALS